MVGGDEHDDIESRKEVLSITAGRKPPGDKETWWEETSTTILRVGRRC